MPTNQMRDMTEIMKMVRNGNPQTVVMNMLQSTAIGGNPMAQNLINLAHAGNSREIEKIARNIAQEKGIDFDKEFNSFKQMFRL